MLKRELASELRDQLGRESTVRCSDDQVIDCYNRCSSCGKKAIPMDDLELVIARISDSDEFLHTLDEIDKTSPTAAHLKDCPEKR